MKNNKDFIKELENYFETTPREKVLEDWAKSKYFDNINSPLMSDYLSYIQNESIKIKERKLMENILKGLRLKGYYFTDIEESKFLEFIKYNVSIFQGTYVDICFVNGLPFLKYDRTPNMATNFDENYLTMFIRYGVFTFL